MTYIVSSGTLNPTIHTIHLTEPNQTHSKSNPSFFKNRTEIKSLISHIPTELVLC